MFKMGILFAPLFFFLFISVAGQELLQISTLHHQASNPDAFQSIQHALGVSVDQEKLNEVSSSILMAEKWLRAHVLSYYPSTNITNIVVCNNLLCDEDQEQISRLVLFAMKNVHHSLVRWGLEKKISVSVCLTPKCLHQSHLKPVFEFLEEINSTYSLKTHGFSDQTDEILSSYLKSMADLGVFRSKSMNLVTSVSKQTSRKLSVTVPSDAAAAAAAAPLPPLIGITMPPEFHFPTMGPVSSAHPPYGNNLPPCNPYSNPHHGGAMADPPVAPSGPTPPVARERVWCVAKPSVPSEKLQEGMDYACGEGGADCGPISPTGSCYFPDSIVAHASYAFNSYWQKKKKNGGTCGFGGTAMLITSDPSFLDCHFTFA